MSIVWQSDNTFRIGEVNFKALEMGLGDQPSTLEQFIFQKPRAMIDRYQQLLAQLQPRVIFELGIWRGGSCVFLQKLAGASKVISVDLSEHRIDALDQYRERAGLAHVLRPYYGVNQADRGALQAILEVELQDSPLDLVIDDASHFLDETRASFNQLFPALRPGGVYVIEDWSWAHGPLRFPDDEPAFYPEREPLTRLVFQLVLACASEPGLVSSVEVDHHLVLVTRGDNDIDPAQFDIARCCLARGRGLLTSER